MNSDPAEKFSQDDALLRVRGLCKAYARRGNWAWSHSRVESLRGVDLEIPAGESLALIGASGSGKSSLARCLACLEKPDCGEIWFAGRKLALEDVSANPRGRPKIQMVFQDPGLSLNPRLTATEIVTEPLLITGWGAGADRAERAAELLKLVGLGADAGGRLPSQFSGGQRRRLSIARALAAEPILLILDEALAGLDLATQAQIANLLLDLQAERGLTYLWILHDLRLVARLASRVAVMDEGRIVETAPTAQLLRDPQSPPGRLLKESILTTPLWIS